MYGVVLCSLVVGVVPCLTDNALKYECARFCFELFLKCLLKYSKIASEFKLKAAN